MNKYKKLIQNSSVFFIANFGSKVLTFLLVRFYTEVLTQTEYGISDVINTTAALAFPLVTLCITEAVLRFSIDEEENRSKILSSGFLITILGNIFFLFFYPVLNTIDVFRDNVLILYLLTLTNSLNTMIVHFSRGIGKTKLFAISGILHTFSQITYNLIFLLAFSWGVKGYILASVFSNLTTMTIVFIVGKLYKYIEFKIEIPYLKKMLLYSIPLIPNSIFWWIMQSSDRYVITYMLTSADNGLYSAANKVPTIITTISTVFFQAWQLSSVEESESKDKNKFYSNVFKIFALVLIMSTSFIMVILQPLYSVLVEKSYYIGWRCVPMLLCAMIFSCFSSFLGTNYVAMKKTKGVFLTTVVGAILNIILNIILTPIMGIYGTALATAISFMVTWILRARDTRKFVCIEYPFKSFVLPLCLILIQASVLTVGMESIKIQVVFFVLITIFYKKELNDVMRKVVMYGRRYIKNRKS